jgi:hypothetical protein
MGEKALDGAAEGARRIAEQGFEIRRYRQGARIRVPLPEADAAGRERGLQKALGNAALRLGRKLKTCEFLVVHGRVRRRQGPRFYVDRSPKG